MFATVLNFRICAKFVVAAPVLLEVISASTPPLMEAMPQEVEPETDMEAKRLVAKVLASEPVIVSEPPEVSTTCLLLCKVLLHFGDIKELHG